MPLSLYLHIPFCSTRCAYCDFNTYAGLEGRIPAYVQALAREIETVAQGVRGIAPGGDQQVHTIFIGGGTPSLLSPESLGSLLRTIRAEFSVDHDAEVTMEANPGSLSAMSLDALRNIGISRLSLGGQSANPSDLALLGRTHDYGDVVESVRAARKAGFDNINVDWILGLPSQTLSLWLATLGRALALGTEHLSIYALSLEFGTPLRAWVMRGLVAEPDPDRTADMYEATAERLQAEGFVQYEISNWARRRRNSSPTLPIEETTFACRHNLQYWRNLPYLGFGAGAHGSAFGWRYSNLLSPEGFTRAMDRRAHSVPPMGPAVASSNHMTAADTMAETMFLGLRMTAEGVLEKEFSRRFGVRMAATYGDELDRLSDQGLVEWDSEQARLTTRGRLLGNRVFEAFV